MKTKKIIQKVTNSIDEINILDREYWLKKVQTGVIFDKKNISFSMFEFAPDNIKKDKELWSIAISNGENWHNAPEELLNDDEFVLPLIQERPFRYIHLTKEQKANPLFYEYCFKNYPETLTYAPYEIKYNKAILLKAVSENAKISQYFPKDFRKDKELGNASFLKNPNYICFFAKSVSEQLLKNPKEVSELIEKHHWVLYPENMKMIHRKLLNDPAFMEPYLLAKASLISLCGNDVINDFTLMSKLCSKGVSLNYVGKKLLSNKEFIINNFTSLSQQFPNKEESKTTLERFAQNYITYMDKSLFDVEFICEMITINPYVINYLPRALQTENKIISQFLHHEKALKIASVDLIIDFKNAYYNATNQTVKSFYYSGGTVDKKEDNYRQELLSIYLNRSLENVLNEQTNTNTKKLKI